MKSYITGFPRIGEQRELKKALESFWAGKCELGALEKVADELKDRHIKYQLEAWTGLISVNDFSFYDLMLDNSVLFGAVPERFANLSGVEQYFAMARGNKDAVAMEMTKWFNTNYHYIVPEISKNTKFSLNADKILNEYKAAKNNDFKDSCALKINLIGPITYLALSKSTDGSEPLAKLDELVEKYAELLGKISALDSEVVIQIDEPIFVTDRGVELTGKIAPVYNKLNSVASNIKIVFMTYFEHATEALKEVVKTDIWAVGLDFVYASAQNIKVQLEILKDAKTTLFAGVIDGRNIWKSDIDKKLEFLEFISQYVSKDRLYVGTSCSLLHVPFTLKYEEKLSPEIKSWLSFACEKLEEVCILTHLFFKIPICDSGIKKYEENQKSAKTRLNSPLIHDIAVQNRVKNLTKFERSDKFEDRIKIQREALAYGDLPTTTIGSFPQTTELRQVRNAYKKGLISKEAYEKDIKAYIDECVSFQEEIGLDILVHGEPERNDMVEYFGEQLKGYAFSANGWVQSYGSRCVKPPLLFGDVSRPAPMTVEWIKYAQGKTSKIMKGMLTGPVTIMNWSFVRDDKPRSEVVKQLALAISDEISDLQVAGIKIIQVDEAAFKEGYPLRKENISQYENFSVGAFKLAVSSADAKTQIHTHMCYSEFNDIIKTIEAMDADVISIETARSGNELLKIFKSVGYKQEVGPGVYDIHSPRVPSVDEMVAQINALLEVLPKSQLWINPDCGLKTRKWEEVKPSLKNMVEAVKIVRG
ncbi:MULTISPECIES: 5-methyltetrahydropteroyltriglutamate--homocysteine S-methyltransferase [unclassified Campylobacter]|uniref:5-methyltetrahydropteroyltriglutamate-- homocysteine S-methyltransferase n=1 Tax=unclassified Campylobacter TaxID=2593542 RepID=UPI0022E9B3B4|nr:MULTISPECIES: 5-methyltetrahydropteroyltriglutamate--homocysteine S-methyltransferase [unclassified Campylobacter]MDA3055135.1 5-methyltetrahydropteroyltriglutamate--homocysteine S-methyltransferase [Campylobacter sp. VBCF_07 NA4]MDA3070904.1 5-methyltetrahydropteroyltriglutamate--homocysteine S-methyltransferase [Campylobacter sp. VBCF_08 NA3]WBR54044.1 5-methyltetrahydropteroyltriglutamate--homocysteine S-methyltransferase [Campylobacter sp. VBCF_01 NA2]